MAFESKNASTHKEVIIVGDQPRINSVVTDTNILQQKELLFLLGLVKNTNFNGSQVELVYNVALKLQNQFLELESK